MIPLSVPALVKDVQTERKEKIALHNSVIEDIVETTLIRLAYEVFSGNLSGVGKLLEQYDPGKSLNPPDDPTPTTVQE